YLDSDSWIQENHYPVIESLLKAKFGHGIDIHIFDHTVLSPLAPFFVEKGLTETLPNPDQTILSGENRIKFHMGSRAFDLLRGRCRIINVWMPLFGPVEDCPLTFCDWNTVNVERDYRSADLIFPHYIGEQYLVTHHSDHRWYFLSGQQTNEFTLLKCWDNKEGVARCVAHTSFMCPTASGNARLRESAEFRCLVFG
ncbi:hypothetical protein QBC40DRAFT_315961, partial [Triangularia verruculosa]